MQRHVCRSSKGDWPGPFAVGWFRRALVLLPLVVLMGCASTGPPPNLTSEVLNEIRFWERSLSEHDEDVRVTVAVPTKEEASALFGGDLSEGDIQPIWLKVANHSDSPYYLITSAVDPNHFSPLEACFVVHSTWCDIDNHFSSMSFKNPIMPDAAVSGFIFANLDEGEKIVQVDLFGAHDLKNFTFFVQIPGMHVDYRQLDFNSFYTAGQMVDLDEQGLRSALENLSCCTTDEGGTHFGDPANLVVIGDFRDVAAAFVRQGWLPAEETYSDAVWKTIKSYLFGSRYRYSPISSLYFFGRHQDFARQKPRRSIHERNHLRLWYSNMRFRGKPVFVGQISRDIGVRFTTQTWPPVTHKIDPDVDEARHALVEDLMFSQMVSQLGFVKGAGEARPLQPRTNLTGDPYFTDGLRAVLVLDAGPVSLQDIQHFKWEYPRNFRFFPTPGSQAR